MLRPFADYPVRPRMEEGESLAGYVSRFHGVNGHRMPAEIHGALRSLYQGRPEKATAAFDLVQSVLGKAAELDRAWWLGRTPLVSRSGNFVQMWPSLKFNAARFCPACLREKGFHFSLWELPMIEACPLHRCLLLTACPICSRGLFWSGLAALWLCHCGQSITAMRYRRAERKVQLVAQALAGSSDVILPHHFQHDFRTPESDRYVFNDVHAALTWGAEFRKFFLKRGSPFPELITPQGHAAKRRPKPGLWEYRLIREPVEKLISRLLRVLKRRFNRRCLLRFVYPNDGLIQAQEFARKSASCVAQTKILKTLDCFLADYAVDLPLSLFVWFSDDKNSKRRNAYMREFATWWAVLADRIGDLDPSMQRTDLSARQQAAKGHSLLKESEVVDILNLLFDAARQGIDVENFRELVYWWRIPSELRDVGNPEKLFRRIGLHLVAASDGEISFVLDLVQRAHRGK